MPDPNQNYDHEKFCAQLAALLEGWRILDITALEGGDSQSAYQGGLQYLRITMSKGSKRRYFTVCADELVAETENQHVAGEIIQSSTMLRAFSVVAILQNQPTDPDDIP